MLSKNQCGETGFGQDCGGMGWDVGSVDYIHNRTQGATLGDACNHGMELDWETW